MLADLLSTHKNMSLTECLIQSFSCFSLGGIDFLIPTVMAFDCYVAICCPLHYATIMNGPVYVKLVMACWVAGFFSTISPTLQKTQFWFCGSKVTDHHFCDTAPILQLSCSNTCHLECRDFFLSLLFVLTTMVLTVVSYIFTVANEKLKEVIEDAKKDTPQRPSCPLKKGLVTTCMVMRTKDSGTLQGDH
ncbi:Olfactory receptor 6V1 [Sciurus carolinensis]|uniref:Olfactory receptor 6V1 n=1 Tax=Sciurus carolinensis TaxID=30640 RepID=A0AA41MXH7_SCICA|nr:Olfactory receptor 6V1 [Sciurus carolinensis]